MFNFSFDVTRMIRRVSPFEIFEPKQKSIFFNSVNSNTKSSATFVPQAFPMKGFTKCHFLRTISERAFMGGRFRCFQRSGELLRAQMSNFNLRRCSISTCFFLASSFRAQMFNFNLLLSGELISGPDVRVSGELLWAQLLESSYGPRFPNSTCVWRAHSGPRFSMSQLASGELLPGPDLDRSSTKKKNGEWSEYLRRQRSTTSS